MFSNNPLLVATAAQNNKNTNSDCSSKKSSDNIIPDNMKFSNNTPISDMIFPTISSSSYSSTDGEALNFFTSQIGSSAGIGNENNSAASGICLNPAFAEYTGSEGRMSAGDIQNAIASGNKSQAFEQYLLMVKKSLLPESGNVWNPDGFRFAVATSADVTDCSQISTSKSCRIRKARTVFSPHQIHNLEKTFETHKYLSKPEKAQLAATLNLSKTQVTTWFQNRRTKYNLTVRRVRDADLRSFMEGDKEEDDEIDSNQSDGYVIEDEHSGI